MTTVVAKVAGSEICCETAEGAAFVKKYTHPPTTIPDSYRGIPDASSPNVVCIEVKGENQVPPILTFPASATATLTNNPSTMLFIHPSGGKVATYNFLAANISGQQGYIQPMNFAANGSVYPATSNLCPPACLNSGYNWKNFINDAALTRTSYKSETLYLNATDFNNQGQITTAKFKPNIIAVNNAATLFEQHANDKASLHSLYRALGHKIPLPKVHDDDGYEVIRANVSSGGPTFGYGIQVLQLGINNNGPVSQLFSSPMFFLSGMLPQTSSAVLTMSSKGSTRMLREGAFVVHQNIGPISDWAPIPSEGVVLDPVANNPNGAVVSLIRVNYSNSYQYAPLYSDTTTAGTGLASWNSSAFDTPWNNLDWAITICEGITVPGTTGTTLSSVPYISVKSFAGLEVQPQISSSLLPFQSMLPKPDPVALQMAAGIFHERPDSLPASANDLGSIAAAIGSFIPNAISWLKNVFTGGSSSNKESNKPNNNRKPQPKPQPRPKQTNTNSIDAKINRLENLIKKMNSKPQPRRDNPGYSAKNDLPKRTVRQRPNNNNQKVKQS